MEDGRGMMEDGRWKRDDGRWKRDDGRWKMEGWKVGNKITLKLYCSSGN